MHLEPLISFLQKKKKNYSRVISLNIQLIGEWTRLKNWTHRKNLYDEQRDQWNLSSQTHSQIHQKMKFLSWDSFWRMQLG